MKLSSVFACVGILIGTAQATYEAECYLPLDVMFLQDTTGSFDEDLPNVVKQIPDMVADILHNHPGSRFGVAEFHDKPFYPLGAHDDFCYKLGGSLTNNGADFRWAYEGLYASGGSDLPESSYHALINVLEDQSVGWRPLASTNETSSDPSLAGARIVIMSTDAVPHLPGDYLSLYDHALYPSLPSYLPPYTGSPYPLVNNDIDWQCRAQDYPAPDQVRSIFSKHAAYLVILTPEDPAIIGAWHWVNEALFGQPKEFYQYIKSDSSDLLAGVLQALRAVTSTACATTTIEPTTTPSTSLSTSTARTTSTSTTMPTTAPTTGTTVELISTTITKVTGTDITREPEQVQSPTTFPASESTALATKSSTEHPTNIESQSSATVELTATSGPEGDDCCPHVEIKLMKAPKQWQMMVAN